MMMLCDLILKANQNRIQFYLQLCINTITVRNSTVTLHEKNTEAIEHLE